MNVKIASVFVLFTILTNAQDVKIWAKTLEANIILYQKVTDDSIFLSIDSKKISG